MVQVIPLLKQFKSQDGLQTSKTLGYGVVGLSDDNDAKNAVLATVPLIVVALNGYPLPINQVDAQQLGDELYEVTVTWGDQQNKNDNKPVVTFDTGGETQKITQSISTSGMYAQADQTAANFNGAIGVTKDGIEGVEIGVGGHKWTEKHYLSDSIVTPAWRIAMTLCSHRTNAAAFRGFDVDQVLFEHVSGSKTGTELWEVTFYFAAGPHLTNQTVGTITGIDKKAWEYLWIYYLDTNDNAANVLVKTPLFAYVEQVYLQGDFTTLAIPQGPII
jgi:hypothetical protein